MFLIECKARFISEMNEKLKDLGVTTDEEYEALSCVIDLDEVIAFNPHPDLDCTTLRLGNGELLAIEITFPKFKELFSQHYGSIKVIGE